MQPSTLVLTATLELHNQIVDDDGFCGYNDDQVDSERLLNDMWELFYRERDHIETPDDLVQFWWDALLDEVSGNLCAG